MDTLDPTLGGDLADVRQRATIEALELIGTPRDPVLDGLVRSAATLTGSPMALISLADGERQWFKARFGVDLTEIPAKQSFCFHVMQGDALMEVPDTHADARFERLELVTGELSCRFYAGVPLFVGGVNIGTLSVIDQVPKSLTCAQKSVLHDLGQSVEHWMRSLQDRNTLRRVAADRQSLFENMAEGVVLIDRHNRMLDANPAILNMLRIEKDRLLGRRLQEVLSGHEHGRLRTARLRNLEDREDLQEWEARRADGSHFQVEVGVRPLDSERAVVVVRDVTERRNLQLQQRQQLEALVAQRTQDLDQARQHAEEANRVKSEFLAAMSHEIRTPMNGVVGIVDVLRQSSLTPYQSDLADTIRDSAFALLGIIEDLLDFSKIEAGRLSLEHEPVPLRRLVEGACEALLPLANSRHVAMRVFVDPVLPTHIVSDALRLRQIITNLASNAIKFSAGLERAGRVLVRLEPGAEGQLCLRVSDNGIGMSGEVLERIFKPFEQAESSTTRRYGGTGLGLSICHSLSSLFGGGIEVQSAPQRGSTFSVTLPLKEHPTPDDSLDHDGMAHDLVGLVCHFYMRDLQLATDWSRYLRDAGAEAYISSDWSVVLRAFERSGESGCVVITDQEQELAGIASPQFAVVSVGEGSQRLAQRLAPGLVSLEANPLRRGNMLHAVALAADRAVEGDASRSSKVTRQIQAPASLDEAAALGRLVLVAEDNEINQKVIQRQLELLGFGVELVEDGASALSLWRAGRTSRRHALLLTDLHMPGMNGYALSAAIRQEEAGEQVLPVVALTASVSEGEMERCTAAGMNDHLAKPVQLDHLAHILARWLPTQDAGPLPEVRRSSQAGDEATDPDVELPVLDGDALTRQVGNDDPGLVAEFRRRYTAAAQSTIAEVLVAANQADWVRVGDLAHRLKSSSRVVGAMRLGACLHALEQAGHASDAETARTLVDRLELELQLVVQQLKAPPVTQPGGTPVTASSRAGRAVLLLDDAPLDMQIMQRQLEQLRVTSVTSLDSGQAALAWLARRDTSAVLVLLDLNMPGMDGVEFMRHLAQMRYAGALALVSGTGLRVLETASQLAQAYRLHVIGHLQKPVTVEALRALVGRWENLAPAPEAGRAKVYTAQEIRRAIAGHELRLHYQPKVRLSDGAWVGVEALVRWQHPVDGLVMPDQFVPDAEANGLIDPLTRSVLRQALAAARNWRAAGQSLRVSANVSMDNLANLDFPEYVHQQVAEFGVPPHELLLEVTESRLARDARASVDILTRLRLKGFGLSIDDFGMGHCSLAQLRNIPFNELKIDRSFVHGCHANSTQQAIFTASLNMAHALGMSVVAEGVENRSDWDFVRNSRADLAQGHFVGRPMPAEALPEWARRWADQWSSLQAVAREPVPGG
jgi:PAS domain S-box-containing protein